MPRTSRKNKQSKAKGAPSSMSLVDKAAASSTNGYALDSNDTSGIGTVNGKDAYGRKRNKRKRNAKTAAGVNVNVNQTTPHRVHHTVQRTFRNITNEPISSTRWPNSTASSTLATPGYLQKNQREREREQQQTATPHNPSTQTPHNPYTNKNRCAPPSSAKQPRIPHSQKLSSTHVICAVSENLARETCLTTMDAGSPVVLEVNKMGNGQMYAETICFLEMMNPHEILLNEGRKNSQLCQKILAVFAKDVNLEDEDMRGNGNDNGNGNATTRTTNTINPSADLTGACSTKTVVKFVPRSYFDQNRGAELLRNIARESALDSSILEEYILLSSSYAVLQYLQICLGANFARNSLDICMNWGGKNRMAIDRSSIAHLELLANAKTGKMQNSLIGTIDCTKTTVGSRLLRTNLMSPPTRLDTINARLDLVDSFLEDEQFFYEVMDQLVALPDVEKMLAHMALVPKNRGGGKTRYGDKRQVTARMASKGISALVCIKSALSVVPNFARAIEIQLKSLLKRDRRNGKKTDDESPNSLADNDNAKPNSHVPNQGDDCNEDDVNDDDDEQDNSGSKSSQSSSSGVESTAEDDDDGSETIATSLLLGLGSGPLVTSGGNRRHQLLRAILIAMKNPLLNEILDAVMDIFTESTTYSKNSHAMRHQECFALKPNTDGMMDVLRKAFLANVSDIYKLADEYAETHGFTVTVKETTARGYYLAILVNSMNSDLPPNFIQPVKTGRFINCTTEEVLSLSSRAQENVQDLLLMTHERIQEVIDIARQKYDALASLSDAIALIDMCHSFADNVASNRLPWCRPIVTDCSSTGSEATYQNTGELPGNCTVGSGSIAIRNGRYAIDVSKTGLMSSGSNCGDFIPNDTYASAFQNFTLLSGINGSGKSTYLKQLAITVILAHCGSYVPAEEAFIPIRDRLCTRIGTSDDQEHNISTFMQEMKDTAFICRNATDRSLILIDELGRATSNEDGVAIAWAVSEFMLVKRAMTFFVTHYPQLCRLADVYPNVQNQHLGTVVEEEGVRYMHKILPGPCQMSADYGIEMAATCGWQRDVVEMARTIREQVEKKLPDDVLCQRQCGDSIVDLTAIKHKAESILNDLAKHLVALKASEERLTENARRSYLQDLHDQYSSPSDPNIVQMMRNLLLDNDETSTPVLPLRPEGLSCISEEQGEINSEIVLNEDAEISSVNVLNHESPMHQELDTYASCATSAVNRTGIEAQKYEVFTISCGSEVNEINEFTNKEHIPKASPHLAGDKETTDLQNCREDSPLSHVKTKFLRIRDPCMTVCETHRKRNDDESSIDISSSSSSDSSSSSQSSESSSSSSSSSSLSSSFSSTEDEFFLQK